MEVGELEKRNQNNTHIPYCLGANDDHLWDEPSEASCMHFPLCNTYPSWLSFPELSFTIIPMSVNYQLGLHTTKLQMVTIDWTTDVTSFHSDVTYIEFSNQLYAKSLRASPPILQNAGWIILTISSSQLVCKPGDPPMTCIQGDKTRKKQKQDESHWHLGNRRGIWSLSFVV